MLGATARARPPPCSSVCSPDSGGRHHVTGMWGSRDGVWSFLLPSRPGIWVVWNTLLGAVCWATGRETGSPGLQVN